MKNKRIVGLILISIMVGLYLIVSYNIEKYIANSGFIQGTTYNIQYKYSKDIHVELDSILHDFDLSLSTYIPNSIISRFNQNDTSVVADKYFIRFFTVATEVSIKTEGAFDITVAPIVNAWGFGFAEIENVDSLLIDSLLEFTGYEKVKLENGKIIKDNPSLMMDGNAIAQGQSVDVIAEFLEGRGIKNYLVDIGGEIRTKGQNPSKKDWRIGVDKPIENSGELDRQLQAILKFSNRSLATSGNYRKFYEKDGIKYSHTINPKTGYPVKHNLLSATVVTNECIYADAYATAFMVIGLEKSIKFIESNPDIEAYLIYSDSIGNYVEYISKGIENLLEKIVEN